MTKELFETQNKEFREKIALLELELSYSKQTIRSLHYCLSSIIMDIRANQQKQAKEFCQVDELSLGV